ncbi:hydroxymethylglutaryl-CoA lyase [Membranihabitans maritimus]|uniref:hydroxymethylglutaryl-CoA lyase n=1 Tax=Membranihabitans maritimus TaxID=2904244 RepID=UPI001F2B9481|nr:hydroxymethylglutaryl-CoA lyase [Membranihabitans maritimus]
MSANIRLIDCPRDAMQGIKPFIPTDLKVRYINALLNVGFHTLDCGSFVSPKAIPQMKDTGEVLKKINLSDSKTKVLVIVANYRGAKMAVAYDQVDYLGFPFSISETFQLRNTNATREEAFERIREIQELADINEKKMVIYFSMCFGNPYGDLWHPDIITYWAQRFREINIHTIALSDTIGIGNPETIGNTVSAMSSTFDNIDFGVHLHTKKSNWKEKVDAAFKNGCTRFDGAIKGFGGCPMAQDELVGNMPSENLINYFEKKELFQYDQNSLLNAFEVAKEIF